MTKLKVLIALVPLHWIYVLIAQMKLTKCSKEKERLKQIKMHILKSARNTKLKQSVVKKYRGNEMEKLKSKPTQCQRILDYMKQYGSITSWEAYRDLSITQLGARLFELKKQGYLFEKERIATTNRMGEKTHYDKYRLVEI